MNCDLSLDLLQEDSISEFGMRLPALPAGRQAQAGISEFIPHAAFRNPQLRQRDFILNSFSFVRRVLRLIPRSWAAEV